MPEKPTEPETPSPEDDQQRLSIISVVASVAAAFFGVQSQQNKERDFQQGNHKVFIAVGAVFTLLFMLTLYLIVHFVTR